MYVREAEEVSYREPLQILYASGQVPDFPTRRPRTAMRLSRAAACVLCAAAAAHVIATARTSMAFMQRSYIWGMVGAMKNVRETNESEAEQIMLQMQALSVVRTRERPVYPLVVDLQINPT